MEGRIEVGQRVKRRERQRRDREEGGEGEYRKRVRDKAKVGIYTHNTLYHTYLHTFT